MRGFPGKIRNLVCLTKKLLVSRVLLDKDLQKFYLLLSFSIEALRTLPEINPTLKKGKEIALRASNKNNEAILDAPKLSEGRLMTFKLSAC